MRLLFTAVAMVTAVHVMSAQVADPSDWWGAVAATDDLTFSLGIERGGRVIGEAGSDVALRLGYVTLTGESLSPVLCNWTPKYIVRWRYRDFHDSGIFLHQKWPQSVVPN